MAAKWKLNNGNRNRWYREWKKTHKVFGSGFLDFWRDDEIKEMENNNEVFASLSCYNNIIQWH